MCCELWREIMREPCLCECAKGFEDVEEEEEESLLVSRTKVNETTENNFYGNIACSWAHTHSVV